MPSFKSITVFRLTPSQANDVIMQVQYGVYLGRTSMVSPSRTETTGPEKSAKVE